MKPESTANPEAQRSAQSRPARVQLRTRLTTLRIPRRPVGTLGLPELGALSIALLLLLTAIVAYFSYLSPQQARAAALEREREQLSARLHATTEGLQRDQDTGTRVAAIVESLDRFETGVLAERGTSSTAIVQELNEKTRRNGLASAQFSFVHEEELSGADLEQQQQRLAAGGAATQQPQRGRRRQGVFPAIDISLTVEGGYANVRHFIRDMEASNRFIVINGIELEGVTEAGPGRSAGATRGQLVSLKLDMSAYFRRSMFALGDTTAPAAATSQ